jgi:SAM-dependent methyltransferase
MLRRASFYDELAPYYHLLYPDWDRAIIDQGAALALLLQELNVGIGSFVLDAACGIGTQALGLLECGYRVTASDLSPGAVARLKSELLCRKLNAEVSVDDLRSLQKTESGTMDAVLACDNSIPHLLSDGEILEALQSCYRCLRPGGAAVFSVREYDSIERKTPDVRPYGMRYDAGSRFLAVQVWEWDGNQYDVRMYLTNESPTGECATQVLRSRYYAVSIQRLMHLMEDAGFADVQRRDGILFQPILLGRRPNSV